MTETSFSRALRETQIVPALLTDTTHNAQHLFDQIHTLSPQPQAVQVDIIDGEFAPNLTISPESLHLLDTHNLALDIHLMTQEPIDFLADLQNLPNLRSVIGQVEHMSSLEDFVESVHTDLGVAAGLALDLYTPFTEIPENVLAQVDVIQVMANQAGEQGQSFHPYALTTLTEIAQWRKNHQLSFALAVDIGITEETLSPARLAGATLFAVGSYLQLETDECQKRWAKLNAALQASAL